MAKQNVRLGAAMAAVLLASSLPYVVAWWIEPPDRAFTGIVADAADWAQYLAWMRAFGQHVVIENVLTCEPQTPAFFNLQWFVLGRTAAIFGLSDAVVIQIFRLATGAAFLLVTWRICRDYFVGDSAPAWAAWILINLSAGLGWIWIADKYLVSGELRFPFDVHIFEPVTFLNIMAMPHFLVAAILLLAIFRLVAAAIESGGVASALWAAALAFVLGLTHAYDLVIVYAVLGAFAALWMLREGFSWRPIWIIALIVLVSSPPPAYFTYLTSTDPLWTVVLEQFANAGVYTPDPLHLLILLGVPLLLVLLTFDGLMPTASPSPWKLLVRVWCVLNFFLLYIPSDFQIHMLNGWQIPLGLLAAEGLFARLLPRLRTFAFFEPLLRTDARVLTLLVALVLPTNLYMLGWRVLVMSRLEHDYFLYRDELAAAAWLDANTANDDVVLAGMTLGQYVPSLSGNKVYLGHWAQTVWFYAKRESLPVFFEAATPEEVRRLILDGCHVRYLVYGRDERDLGSLDPASLPYLELVFENGGTRVFRVR